MHPQQSSQIQINPKTDSNKVVYHDVQIYLPEDVSLYPKSYASVNDFLDQSKHTIKRGCLSETIKGNLIVIICSYNISQHNHNNQILATVEVTKTENRKNLLSIDFRDNSTASAPKFIMQITTTEYSESVLIYSGRENYYLSFIPI